MVNNFAKVKHELLATFKMLAKEARNELMDGLGELSEDVADKLKQEIMLHREIIRILSEQAASFVGSNGNIYIADTPEDDALLDWENDTQPAKVQKGIHKVITKLETWNVPSETIETLKNAKTGETFYHSLEEAVKTLVKNKRLRSKKHGLISRPDMAASLLLNQAGIPGLRYWDASSRKSRQGTHNFVIWNTDMIKMLGLTDDSDDDAKQYFRDTARAKHQGHSEIYHQTAGKQQNYSSKTHIDADNIEFLANNLILYVEDTKALLNG